MDRTEDGYEEFESDEEDKEHENDHGAKPSTLASRDGDNEGDDVEGYTMKDIEMEEMMMMNRNF